jgi:uncharacterized protein (DUF2267 family)
MTGLGLLSLVIGVILAGMAVTSAQEGTSTPTATPEATTDAGTATPDSTDDSTDDSSDTDDTDNAGYCGGRYGGWRMVEDAAGEVLGLTHAELRAAFDDGQTLADIAEAQGMSADDLKAAVVENVTAALQEDLDAGDITQDQFDTATANLSDNIDDFINNAAPERGAGHGLGVWRLVEDAVATILGVTEGDLHDAFDDGQTLADIAEAQGMSADDLKAGIIESVTAELQTQLDAGDITQDQFDALTSELNDSIDDIVNSARPMGGPGGHHGGRGVGPGGYFGDDTGTTDDSTETTTEA